MTGPLVIAHRGVHTVERENTMAAFEAARTAGAQLVELDVRRTADDRLVIFHDAEAAKTAIHKLTHEQLIATSGTEVPELEQVLEWASHAGMGLDVELKENGYVPRVVDLLRDFGAPLLVTSFLDPVIAQLTKLAPHIRTGLIFSMTALGAVKRLHECGADAAVLEMKLVKDPILDELAAAGSDIYAWDFLPARPGQLAWLLDARIEGFITDDVSGTLGALADSAA